MSVPGSAMRAAVPTDLTLRRASSNIVAINNLIRDPRPFFAQPITKSIRMAEKPEITMAEAKPIEPKLEEQKKKESENATKAIPPPPEKPLPDDCCGSGCVRCVWDIYYEELEEYSMLYKQD